MFRRDKSQSTAQDTSQGRHNKTWREPRQRSTMTRVKSLGESGACLWYRYPDRDRPFHWRTRAKFQPIIDRSLQESFAHAFGKCVGVYPRSGYYRRNVGLQRNQVFEEGTTARTFLHMPVEHLHGITGNLA